MLKQNLQNSPAASLKARQYHRYSISWLKLLSTLYLGNGEVRLFIGDTLEETAAKANTAIAEMEAWGQVQVQVLFLLGFSRHYSSHAR